MSLTRFETTARYSEAVVHGGTVYLSGQVPENTLGQPAAAQVADVLALIEQRLVAAGSSRAHMLSATVYLTHLARDYAVMNAAWDAFVPAGTAPCRTCVGVAALAREGWVVEITVVAAVAE